MAAGKALGGTYVLCSGREGSPNARVTQRVYFSKKRSFSMQGSLKELVYLFILARKREESGSPS